MDNAGSTATASGEESQAGKKTKPAATHNRAVIASPVTPFLGREILINSSSIERAEAPSSERSHGDQSNDAP